MIACIAHNLTRWTSLIGLPGETLPVARTLRRRLLAIPGRLTRSGRQWTLHLPARWPWQGDFTRALARIRALPAASCPPTTHTSSSPLPSRHRRSHHAVKAPAPGRRPRLPPAPPRGTHNQHPHRPENASITDTKTPARWIEAKSPPAPYSAARSVRGIAFGTSLGGVLGARYCLQIGST